jgi:hypothetical protein
MKQSVLASLSEKDTQLVLETKRKNLETLDEDALLELHSRVRRARNKHSKNYRRAAASRVGSTGTRGGASKGNQPNRDRAEALEDALARVSKRLATVARRSATALRVERLSAAAGAKGDPRTPGTATPGGRGRRPADRDADRRPKTPARLKRAASSQAAGARRQAERDHR